jgi:hypothetical protein
MFIAEDAVFAAALTRARRVSRKALRGALVRYFPMRLSGSPVIPVRSVRIHDRLTKLITIRHGLVRTEVVAAGSGQAVNCGPKRFFTTYSPVDKGS